MCVGFIPKLLRRDGFSKRWNSHCKAGKPLYLPEAFVVGDEVIDHGGGE